MKNKIEKALDYGAQWRIDSMRMIWPDKGTPQFHEMIGFEKAIVWYQKYLKTLLKDGDTK